jgi:organic hydroperoxide reductase OsmC/OhrA
MMPLALRDGLSEPPEPAPLPAAKLYSSAGRPSIPRVDLHPNIAYGGAKQPTPADLDWLHDKAHRECFIANSVTTKISVAPTK